MNAVQSKLEEVKVHNGRLIRRGLELNRRAGAEIVPVMDRDALLAWLAPRLGGAKCAAEVLDWTALRLAEIDATVEARVRAENPDTVTVAGRELTVTYADGEAPSVRWEIEDDSDLSWQELPDVDVALPGGRAVSIVVYRKWYGERASGTDLKAVKAAMIARVNENQWSNWSKPNIPVPTDGKVTITEANYGTCIITSAPLTAYGTLEAYQCWPADPITWYPRWYRTRAEAVTTQSASQAKVDAQRPRIEAEALRTEIAQFRGDDGWWDLPPGLRNEVEKRESRYYSPLPSDVDGIETWLVETRDLKARVDVHLATAAERKAEEARRAAEAEAIVQREIEPILPLVEHDDRLARAVLDLAQHMESQMGAAPAAKLLRGELNATYGRDGRQAVIRARVPSLEDTDGGAWFLGISRARDVNMWLDAAATWLESRIPVVPAPKPSAKPAPQAPAAPGSSGGLNLTGLFGGVAVVKTDRRR